MTKRRIGKKIAAWLMCLAMVLTTVNLPAFTTTVQAEESWVEVSTYDALKTELAKSGDKHIKLVADINSEDTMNRNTLEHSGGNTTLDLNGHNISRVPEESTDDKLFNISGGEVILLNSTDTESSIYFKNTQNAMTSTIYTAPGASLTVGSNYDCGPIVIDGYDIGINNAGGTTIFQCVSVGTETSDAHYISGNLSTNNFFGGTFYGGAIIHNVATLCSATIYGKARGSVSASVIFGKNVYVSSSSEAYVDDVEQIGYIYFNGDPEADKYFENQGTKTEIRHVSHIYETIERQEPTLVTPGKEISVCQQCGVTKDDVVPFTQYAGASSGFEFDEETATFTVYGTGSMYDYDYDNSSTYAPWFQNGYQHIYKKMKKIVIEDGITNVGNESFRLPNTLRYYDFIEEIVLPATVTNIGTRAFKGSAWLEKVNLGDKITSIGESAFENCSALETITVPSGDIGNSCFDSCTSLTSITFGDKVSSLGGGVFEKDANLTDIYFEGNAPSFNKYAFQGITATVHYPADDSSWDAVINKDYGGRTITWAVKQPSITLLGDGNPKAHNGMGTIYTEREPGKLVLLSADETYNGQPFDKWVSSDVEILEDTSWEEAGFYMPNHDVTITAKYKNPHVHVGTLVPQKNATCTEFGVKSHYECECGVVFTDSECANEITDFVAWKNGDGKIEMKAHSYTVEKTAKVDATCTTDGKTAVMKCATCDATQGGEIIAKLGHDYKVTDNVASSETVAGYTEYTCTRCSDSYKDAKPLADHVHDWVEDAEVPATCATDGIGAGKHCSKCSDTDGYAVIPATGVHSYTVVKDAKVAATCTEDGKEAVMKCTGCDKTIGGEKIPATGHSYASVWTSNEKSHWRVCTSCGDKAEEATHTFDAGKVTKEATESAEGIKTYTCTVCGQTKTETIPKKEAAKPDDKKPDDQKPESPKKGDALKDDKTGAQVKVLDPDKKEVVFVAPKDAKAKTITVPATITVNGVTYKVTKINDGAFKGNKTVTKIVLPSSITVIGKDAFNGCSKLKTITIPKNVIEIGANAFKGCASITKITLPSKVTKIGANAFNGCKKLKTLTIKTSKLTDKNVGSKAFKGINAKAKVKVPKAKLKAYKKILKKKGISGKKQKITK